ncbi:MAG: hypothetical protein WCD11_29540 [Solirubrobacteraceae bacterium]
MSNAATMSMSVAVAQWTPKATAFGPRLADLAGDAESGGGWSGIEKVPGAHQGDSDGDHS